MESRRPNERLTSRGPPRHLGHDANHHHLNHDPAIIVSMMAAIKDELLWRLWWTFAVLVIAALGVRVLDWAAGGVLTFRS